MGKASGLGNWLAAGAMLILAAMLLVSRQVPEPPHQGSSGTKRDLAYLSEDRPELGIDTLPAGRTGIVACNEHVEDLESARLLLSAMDALGISRACIMGAPAFTFTGDKEAGFAGYRANNDVVIQAANQHPDRFVAFVTLDPLAQGNLEALKGYLTKGARGLRLYLGRGDAPGGHPFHVMSLDDPRMLPLYEYCEANHVPVVMDVNLNKFTQELESVLERYPKLHLMVTHWGISKNTEEKLHKLSLLMGKHPGLFFGLSFGGTHWQVKGFEKLARWPKRYGEFLSNHRDRFVFSGSTVVSADVAEDYPSRVLRSYRQLLEMKAFRFYERPAKPMRGLGLPGPVLDAIYTRTPARFLDWR